jgi:group I intron endonuclease
LNDHGNVVYLIKNKVNGKLYVGKSNDFKKRWINHKSIAFNENHSRYKSPIYCAMRKYSLENFETSILESDLENDEITFEREKYWISKLNTKAPNGYNLTDGGEGVTGIKLSEEHKEKLRIANTGKKHTYEVKKRMSVYWTENSPNRGKSLSLETRKKMSDSKKGIHKPVGFGEKVSKAQGKGVIMVDMKTGQSLKDFISTYKAANWLRENTSYEKASFSKIAAVCRGDRASIYGYKWKYKIKGEVSK